MAGEARGATMVNPASSIRCIMSRAFPAPTASGFSIASVVSGRRSVECWPPGVPNATFLLAGEASAPANFPGNCEAAEK